MGYIIFFSCELTTNYSPYINMTNSLYGLFATCIKDSKNPCLFLKIDVDKT